MNGIVIIGALVAAVTLASLLMRVPAALVFFSLLVGQLLSEQVSDDVYYFVGSMVSASSGSWIKPILIALPVILTLLFLRGAVGKGKIFFEFVPAVLTGITAALLLVPVLPVLNRMLIDSEIWANIVLYKSLIIFTASLASLITCWFSFSKSGRL